MSVYGQFSTNRSIYMKAEKKSLHPSSIQEQLLCDFEAMWGASHLRWQLVPGKEVLSKLNQHLQQSYRISITPALIVSAMRNEDIPIEMRKLIDEIDMFRQRQP